MKRLIIAIAVAGLLLVSSATAVFADHIPPHQHFIVNPNGDLVSVGPDACANGASTAFDNFHLNVHVSTPNFFAFDHPHNPVDLAAAACP